MVRATAVSVAGLPGTLEAPTGMGPFPAVVLVGGSGPGDRDETLGPNKPFRDIAVGLAEHGIASVRYDKRTRFAAGRRAARSAAFTPTREYVPDAIAAIKLLRTSSKVDRHRIFVLGHSQGGTFAPRIATRQPALAGVILLAAGAAPFGSTLARQVRYLADFDHGRTAAERSSIAQTRRWASLVDNPRLSLRTPRSHLPGELGPRYWLDLTHYHAVATARKLPQPLLVLQGGRDYQVTVADDLRLWTRGLAHRPNVTTRVFPLANHLFFDGTGRPNPQELALPSHVSPNVIASLVAWILSQPPRP